jgi:hypothetical protein
MSAPSDPRIFHILHVDRLRSVIRDGFLWSDAKVARSSLPGTEIGMCGIKKRRRAG